MILLTDVISQSSNFCVIVLDETTYYITAFAVDSNNTVISSQTASVTTDFWWHPSANTLARYKFENNLNDSSWNSRNLTSSWSISYNSNPLSVQLNSSSYLYRNSFDAFNHDWTLNVWFNLNARNTDSSCILFIWEWARQKAMILWIENTWKPIAAFYGQDSVGSTITQLNQRYNICYVYDNTTKNIKVYINSIKDIDASASYTITNTTAYIWWFYFMTPQSRSAFQWKLSQYIIEKKKRSETDITEYFNKMKSKYWY